MVFYAGPQKNNGALFLYLLERNLIIADACRWKWLIITHQNIARFVVDIFCQQGRFPVGKASMRILTANCQNRIFNPTTGAVEAPPGETMRKASER